MSRRAGCGCACLGALSSLPSGVPSAPHRSSPAFGAARRAASASARNAAGAVSSCARRGHCVPWCTKPLGVEEDSLLSEVALGDDPLKRRPAGWPSRRSAVGTRPRPAFDEAGGLEVFERERERARRDPRELGAQLGEAAGCVERRENRERPLAEERVLLAGCEELRAAPRRVLVFPESARTRGGGGGRSRDSAPRAQLDSESSVRRSDSRPTPRVPTTPRTGALLLEELGQHGRRPAMMEDGNQVPN